MLKSTEEATWEDTEDFHKTFPQFILEEKDASQEGAIVANSSGEGEHQE